MIRQRQLIVDIQRSRPGHTSFALVTENNDHVPSMLLDSSEKQASPKLSPIRRVHETGTCVVPDVGAPSVAMLNLP